MVVFFLVVSFFFFLKKSPYSYPNRWILNHWAKREVLSFLFLRSHFLTYRSGKSSRYYWQTCHLYRDQRKKWRQVRTLLTCLNPVWGKASGAHLMSRQPTSLVSHSCCLHALGPQEFQGHQMSQLWNLLTRPASTFLMFRREVKLLFLSSWSKKGKFDLPDLGCYLHNLTVTLSEGTITSAGSLCSPCHLLLSCPTAFLWCAF